MTPEEVWQQYSRAYGVDTVEAFQHFFGLMQTGVLDTETTHALTQPRCGLRDNLVVISEAKWRKRELAWFVEKYPPGLDTGTIDSIYAAAWKSWADVCDKRFRQVGSVSQADIILSTGSGRADGFDGPGGTLAWMTLGTNNDNPILGRFDVGDRWVNDPARDIYLLAVAAHEFGHALNLDHAPQSSGALMAPFYSRRVFKPTQHDIQRIQALYGPPVGEPTPPPTAPGDEGWLRRLYQDLTGRAPSAAELAAWIAELNAKHDRMVVCRALLNSSEYHTRLVTGWYEAYLRRKPDGGGLANFVRALDGGFPVKEAVAVVLSSPEYYLPHSGSSIGLDPQRPIQPSPPTGGGPMNFFRDILIQIVTAVLEPFRRIPFFGRFITPALIEKIVDAILSRLGPTGQVQVIEAALQAMPSAMYSLDENGLKEAVVEVFDTHPM